MRLCHKKEIQCFWNHTRLTSQASERLAPKLLYKRTCRPWLWHTPSPIYTSFTFLVTSLLLLNPRTELATDKRDVVGGGDAGLCLDDGEVAAALSSKAVVEELYRALERGDVDAVRRLLNPDVDWWFHGPRAHQHLVLMRLLTGGAGAAGLPFKIRSLDAFGPTVLAEGTDATGALYWVHAWTVGPGGRVTEVREYCNTALVVTRLGGDGDGDGDSDSDRDAAVAETPCSQSQSKQVWQSRLPDRARRNLPGLVLAI
jgi:limonene-1,2-epoxide hydrolase